jgi:hypothetical protein
MFYIFGHRLFVFPVKGFNYFDGEITAIGSLAQPCLSVEPFSKLKDSIVATQSLISHYNNQIIDYQHIFILSSCASQNFIRYKIFPL